MCVCVCGGMCVCVCVTKVSTSLHVINHSGLAHPLWHVNVCSIF